MNAFELYILKSSIAISVFYTIYILFLRNEPYFKWNRIYLLSSLIISFFVPLVNYTLKNTSGTAFSNLLLPVIIDNYYSIPKLTITSNSLSILSIIYINGAVFFSLRFFSSVAQIHYLYFRYPKIKLNGFKAVMLDENQSPFTFFHILFISRDDYVNGRYNEMIAHEDAHRKELHSLDIILLEIMAIIQWFNPLLWLFKQALMSEHEFIADDKVLKEGYNKGLYQKLLLEKSLGITALNLTCNLNYSLLKKRFQMMTNNKSKSLAKIKYILSLPLMLIMCTLLAINIQSFGQKKERVYTEVDVMPVYKTGNIEDVRLFIAENLKYPKIAFDNQISACFYVVFVVDKKGKVTNVRVERSDVLDKDNPKNILVKGYKPKDHPKINAKAMEEMALEAVRVVKLIPDFKPGMKDGKNVNVQYTFPVRFVLKKKKRTK